MSPFACCRTVTRRRSRRRTGASREHLWPWEPSRPTAFFTAEEQQRGIHSLLEQYESDRAFPLVLVQGEVIVGRLNVTGIVRGAFQSGSVGYWVDGDRTGQGLATAALRQVVSHARSNLALHRLEAGTLLHNVGSQRVLTKAGFQSFGVAPKYLKIAGRWQDHKLFQLILE